MSASIETRLSSSLNQYSMAPVGPSVAETLPNINFGFDDLRERMNKFSTRFDAFIERGRKRVLEERNQFHMRMAELNGMCRKVSRLGQDRSETDASGCRGPTHEEERHRDSAR